MERFLIAPFDSGLFTALRPWQIPDDAFARLTNAVVFRGRVRKRFGSSLLSTSPLESRLRINIGTTNAVTGNFNLTPVTPAGSVWKIGQQFSVGSQIFTVYQANGAMLATTGTGTGTFNTATGALVITGAALNTAVYYYPSEPVMGFEVYEKVNTSITAEPTYAFDTRFAYVYTTSGWERSGSGTNPMWHSTNSQFFWTTNWFESENGQALLFVTNFRATIGAPGATDDPIYYFDGTTWTAATGGSAFTFLTAGNAVSTARIIVGFKNRLLLLNTVETNAAGNVNTAYPNRCRYSKVGSPITTDSWLESTEAGSAGASFLDADTDEEIIGCEFIKDRLIVYFEESTFELVWTRNEQDPFIFQRINTELGSQSTFSTIPFDKFTLAISNTSGINSCSGANVERIDSKIPTSVFQIRNRDDGIKRVQGIRDYYSEMALWSYPSIEGSRFKQGDPTRTQVYPNRILVYNYKNSSFAFFEDTITAFGYIFPQNSLDTWEEQESTWLTYNNTWSSPVLQQAFRQVLAGNQQGYTFIMLPTLARNAAALTITNMTASGSFVNLTIKDHNLVTNEYILIENVASAVGISGIYKVTYVENDTVSILATLSSAYTGGGTAARVSNLNILSKQWNPYDKKGRNVYISKIDFIVAKTSSGQVTVDAYPSSTELSTIQAGQATSSILGSNILETSPYALEPIERDQARLYHPTYFQCEGESVQIYIYMSDEQITNQAIALSEFEIQGIVLHAISTADRFQ